MGGYPHPVLTGVPPVRKDGEYPPVGKDGGLYGGTPSPLADGVLSPPPQVRTDTQTENITFPHPSDAGGKNAVQFRIISDEAHR